MLRPRQLLWITGAATSVALSALPVGPLPPLGRLLDPSTGLFSAAHQAAVHDPTVLISSLDHPVRVAIDARGVPHIFARTDLDAWRTLGWLHARDRLFQLDLQTRATEGTLTEWVGPVALPLDREMRHLGLGHLADSLWDRMDTAGPTRRALLAYAEGVNARIAALGPRDLPLEYRLLGVRPRPWRPEYTLYLAERMAYNLSWQETDREREAMATLVGDRAAAALLPAVSPIQEPIIPVTSRGLPSLPTELPPPGPRSSAAHQATAAVADAGVNDLQAGSNNWAISPGRSADHHALLAGDPHLDLTLPSTWYEAHLVTEDGLDIYGATLPGAPAVLIGLTPGVAWSFTNSEGDFVDQYRERVDDRDHPSRYRVDGTWYPVATREERYLDRRGHTLAVDTVLRTRRGPLSAYAGEWRSIRWTALEAKDPIGAFLTLQRARSVADFLAAMAPLEVPAQNGVAADTAGHIAEFTAGRFPRRPNNDGGVVFDGSLGASDWAGDLPAMPRVVDPARGVLFSANQQGIDPRVDPAYRGNGWAPPWRAMRLARLTTADSAVTVAGMRRWQTDPYSERALWWLPAIIAAARTDSSLTEARALLMGWKDGYRPASRGAALFERTMDEAGSLTWDELALNGRVVAWPSAAVFAELRDRPDDIWWDRQATPEREDRDDILRLALHQAWDHLRGDRVLGPDTATWRWDRWQRARIPHIAFLPGLGRESLAVTGGNGTLSPLSGSGSHGPSWRMVVDLTPRPQAWTTYPGGQSGNPASARYDDRIGEWQRGDLDSARLPRTIDELGSADRREEMIFTRGVPTAPNAPWTPRWWTVVLAGTAVGAVAGRRGWSAWWGVLAGVVLWGGTMLLTWEPGATLRLAMRLGALFGGTPAWAVLVMVPLWGGMLAGFAAAAVRSVVAPSGAGRATAG